MRRRIMRSRACKVKEGKAGACGTGPCKVSRRMTVRTVSMLDTRLQTTSILGRIARSISVQCMSMRSRTCKSGACKAGSWESRLHIRETFEIIPCMHLRSYNMIAYPVNSVLHAVRPSTHDAMRLGKHDFTRAYSLHGILYALSQNFYCPLLIVREVLRTFLVNNPTSPALRYFDISPVQNFGT